MAKRSTLKTPAQANGILAAGASEPSPGTWNIRTIVLRAWIPLLLAVIAFLVYWPSLKSDFVYDARVEILDEGFITNLSHLPEVLSLKVLGSDLMLASRPGHLLYLMSIASVCGKEPFGYHLCSDLLHAANVALLFILLVRLAKNELPPSARNHLSRLQITAAVVTLLFALHPLATEVVANVSYSSDLLITLFTLLTLLAATAFDPANLPEAQVIGCAGGLSALAAVSCKESGLAAAGLLIVYWFLYRRHEPREPWFWFIGSATLGTALFLTARLAFAAPPVDPAALTYLGGSFFRVFLIQPRLWVFMMGKMAWPSPLSADYTPENIHGLTTGFALIVLLVVVALQAWLAMKSRLGALGVATYWLGLVTVSNFIPLYRFLGDRFYYLPMAGVAMQLVALLMMTFKFRTGAWEAAILPCLLALVPLTLLTVNRENVFSNQFTFWSETVRVSPFSSNAHSGLGYELFKRGQVDAAIAEYHEALKINPSYAEGYNNLGFGLFVKGRTDEAITLYRKALQLEPNLVSARINLGDALLGKNQVNEGIEELEKASTLNSNLGEIHYNLGNIFLKIGRNEEAITQFQKALEINPDDFEARTNFGLALSQEREVEQAVVQFQRVVDTQPGYAVAHFDLATNLAREGRDDEALIEFQKALELDPNLADAHYNFGNALIRKGRLDEAIAEFQRAVDINPDFVLAHANLALALSQKGRMGEALVQFREVVRLAPKDANARANLAKMEARLKKAPISK